MIVSSNIHLHERDIIAACNSGSFRWVTLGDNHNIFGSPDVLIRLAEKLMECAATPVEADAPAEAA